VFVFIWTRSCSKFEEKNKKFIFGIQQIFLMNYLKIFRK